MATDRYLLDTTVVIDFSKGREPAASRLRALLNSGADVGVCAITIAEFFANLAPTQRQTWLNFFAALPYQPISPEAAAQAGIWRYQYARLGITLTTADTLIAAAAEEFGAIVLTENTKDFPMPEVTTLSLRGA